MSKRGVGLLLVLTLIIALGTLVQDFRFDSLIAREHIANLAVDREFGSLGESLAALRAAQAGYVATGQAPAAWMTRGSELFSQIEDALGARRSAAQNTDARSHYEAATQALTALGAIDRRARASVEQDDRLHASDLIFMDAIEAGDNLAAAISAARAIEARASSQRTSRLATLRLAMNGIAVLFGLAVAIYFGRAVSILGAKPVTSTAQMIKELPPPVKNGSPPAQAPTAPPVPAPIQRPLGLTAAAELCVDLARVLDGRDVPALLERTATILDAKGVVLWALDPDGAMLRPTLCHGYSEKVLSKLRPLQIDADNVTSLAFRSLQAQSLNGASATDSGAIAVPLITPTGCVGVLAAEIRQSRPHVDLLALARIIAAQFSTLVAPAEAPESKVAQA